MRRPWASVALVCGAMLAVCSAPAATAATKPAVPLTQPECAARGGEWILFPAAQFHFCRLATADGGKRCDAADDCEGECRAVRDAVGAGKHGECSRQLIEPGGCPEFFEHGTVVAEPCV